MASCALSFRWQRMLCLMSPLWWRERVHCTIQRVVVVVGPFEGEKRPDQVSTGWRPNKRAVSSSAFAWFLSLTNHWVARTCSWSKKSNKGESAIWQTIHNDSNNEKNVPMAVHQNIVRTPTFQTNALFFWRHATLHGYSYCKTLPLYLFNESLDNVQKIQKKVLPKDHDDDGYPSQQLLLRLFAAVVLTSSESILEFRTECVALAPCPSPH